MLYSLTHAEETRQSGGDFQESKESTLCEQEIIRLHWSSKSEGNSNHNNRPTSRIGIHLQITISTCLIIMIIMCSISEDSYHDMYLAS